MQRRQISNDLLALQVYVEDGSQLLPRQILAQCKIDRAIATMVLDKVSELLQQLEPG